MFKRFSLTLLFGTLFFIAGCGPATPAMQTYVSPSSTPVPRPGAPKQYYTIFSPPPVPVAVNTDAAATATIPLPVSVTNPPPNVITPPTTMSYEKALSIYGNGYRLQFSNCSANPGSFTIKHGISFMLDNRDPEGHIISVGLTNYRVNAYSFAIIKITTPGTTHITCDGGGSAKIIVSP